MKSWFISSAKKAGLPFLIFYKQNIFVLKENACMFFIGEWLRKKF
jgi:hypothetical protein